ncbi:MAG TPA: ABC transporter permease [Mycobacteriales bacterium]|jgi:ABC-type dipeptide/oligopeptide/nickel transport system permease subunit|nr:ABC transporter permease [Mycobacteriales bacterium]
MTTPLESMGTAADVEPSAILDGAAGKAIEGRSLGQIAWLRFKRDKVALGSIAVLVILVVFTVLAPVINKYVGVDPFSDNIAVLNFNTGIGTPVGHFGGITSHHPFGVEPINGRDLLARIDVGARYSLIIALASTALSVAIGTFFGAIAGFFGGATDTLISRFMDILLAFPSIIFAIAIAAVIEATPSGGGLWTHVLLLIGIIGFLSSPYFGRIIRGQVLSLREKEFVDAARGIGASNGYIMFRELLPNMYGPILVYSTLIIPTNILFEAALSYLGVGIPLPNPSWGNMLSDATGSNLYQVDPWFAIIPGVAIFVTVMAFNLFGDGLRDALDPRSNR